MKSLVIGNGQVGQAIYSVIRKHHEAYVRDLEDYAIDNIEVLHICYPEHDDFIETTRKYILQYKAAVVVIHSSIRVGTCNKLSDNIVYSPVRGRHPKLASDLLIYPKFIFSNNEIVRNIAFDYFDKCGFQCYSFENPSAGELLKLLSNIHMGIEIAWRQEVDRILKHYGVNSAIYEEWEESYQIGYTESGDSHIARPLMRPDPIGGHCIIPCTEILAKQFPSKIFDFVLDSNQERLREAK